MYNNNFWINLLCISVLIGLIPAAIAHNKGHSFVEWWFLGAAIFIVALPMAILLKPNTRALEQEAISTGGRKCPYCAEIIKREAKVCRFCGREVQPLPDPIDPIDPNDLSVLSQQINPLELNQSDEYYYKQGLKFMQQRLYDKARLEFVKTIQRSSPRSKWYSSAQARLLEIKTAQPVSYNQTNTQNPHISQPPKPVASYQANTLNQTNTPNSKILEGAKQSSVRLCPKCGIPMEIKVVTNEGAYKGKSFYVCPNYKQCQQVFPLQ